jgi:hypothetical protein
MASRVTSPLKLANLKATEIRVEKHDIPLSVVRSEQLASQNSTPRARIRGPHIVTVRAWDKPALQFPEGVGSQA